MLVPPEPNILVENCGASVAVVITKSDLHTSLSEEQLNKVQYHVRRFCLQRGAALVCLGGNYMSIELLTMFYNSGIFVLLVLHLGKRRKERSIAS